MKKWDSIWINATLVTCEQNYGIISNAAIGILNNKIAWLGKMQELSAPPIDMAEQIYDAQDCCITPGLIDCHTHLVYAGNRANEFEERLQGASYEKINQGGGGIQSTVNATRLCSEDELFKQSLPRAKALAASGVTTLEIKSGYGLDDVTELKILRVAKRIEDELSLTISKTFLGAHTIPKEYVGRGDSYIDFICEEMIPKISRAKLADAVDVFCEKIAFNLDQTERVFKTAKDYGLRVKCHSEQLSNSGSAKLAAKYNALSVDHLEHISLEDIYALVKKNTVAVLLPGAFYFLREKKLPPVDLLREHQIPIAIASDCNPGTSPIMSLLLILNMACTLFRLTPEEALIGATYHAAKALGVEKLYGSLVVNKMADLAIWDIKHPAELAYYMGANPLRYLVKHGKIIVARN